MRFTIKIYIDLTYTEALMTVSESGLQMTLNHLNGQLRAAFIQGAGRAGLTTS